MGTSKSSTGAPSGVPMVPSWVPDPVPPDDAGDGTADDQGNPDNPDQQQQGAPPPLPNAPPVAVPLAPRARFGPARTSLGRYSRSRSGDDMRRGVGHYVSKGLGGSGSAARRFGGAARTAGTLYGALSAAAAGQPSAPGSPLDPALLAGRSANDVMDAVVEAVRPVDGTQDAESSRRAIHNSLSELLERFPDADLLNLAEEQRLFVIERYLAADVYNRVDLDVGNAVRNNAPSASAALSRMRELRNYIRETIAASFRALRAARTALSARRIAQMSSQALRDAFAVFEDYVQ